MFCKYFILVLIGSLFLSSGALANNCRAWGPNTFYFSVINETPSANNEHSSPPILIHDESALYLGSEQRWVKLPDYRVDQQGMAIFEHLTTGAYNARLRYDIYEPYISVKGPIVYFDYYGCTVDGKNMITFNTENYAYTITARSVCSGSMEIPDACYVDYRYRVPGEAPYQVNLTILNKTDQTLIQSTGTFTDGLLFLGADTQCSAEGYSNCGKAALTDIMPGKISPDFVFVAGAEDHILDAELSYLINDPELADRHQVIVEIVNGDDLLDRCQARIDPPTTGLVLYQAQTSRVGELDCFVTITRQAGK